MLDTSHRPSVARTKSRIGNTIRVGFFLANRQIRSSVGTSVLVITVMVLTYLNLLVVSGVMVGIVQGLRNENQARYSGDLIISNLDTKNSIQNSPDVQAYLRGLPTVSNFSARYLAPGTIEGNYAGRLTSQDKMDTFTTTIAGIDPLAEDTMTGLSHLVIEGQYLQSDDYDQVLLGTSLLARYKALTAIPGATPIPNVGVGSRVRILIGNVEREMTVKGVVASKIEGINLRAFMVDSQMRLMLGRTDDSVNEIAVKLARGADVQTVEHQLQQSFVGSYAKIQSEPESEPAFMQDFSATFSQLGSFLGSIGLVVAFIVIFILVLINTIVHRRSIGILQAVGIQSAGIELGYVVQSVLYAIIGAAIGMAIVFGVLVPFFNAHPINFPFSNGILTVTFADSFSKALILVLSIVLASYVPARIILRQEIVDSILGR